MRDNLDFDAEFAAFLARLGKSRVMYLATGADGRIACRAVSCVILDEDVFFQTDRNFLKYRQITANSSVALSFDNVSIEGAATDAGHPSAAENAAFRGAYEGAFKASFGRYSALPDETVIKVRIQKVTLWEYENDRPLRLFFDVAGRVCYREFY